MTQSQSVTATMCWLIVACLCILYGKVNAKTLVEHQVHALDQHEAVHDWNENNLVTAKTNGRATNATDAPNVSDSPPSNDPMLAKMPDYDFWAYRRADISSFYQEPPGTRVEQTPSFNGQAGKFVNMSPEKLDLYWDGGGALPGHYICSTQSFESCGTATFPTHVFHFVRPSNQEIVCTFHVVSGTSVYYCDPFRPNDAQDPSAGVVVKESSSVLPLQGLNDEQLRLYQAAQLNREFAVAYKNFTGGSEWLANYPAQPPHHFIWRADYFGQQHTVETVETHFTKLPPVEEARRKLSIVEMQRETSAPIPLQDYRQEGPMNITLTVVSVAPRILQIDGFLSDVEVDHILDLAHQQHLHRSSTGMGNSGEAHISTVRTSRNTWLPRHSSPILDAVIKRAADVLKIDEDLMRRRTPDERPDFPTQNSITEDLQLVHYDKGQEYTAHHDFGYPDTRPNSPSRSINLCMYLNEGMEGGETAFPRWRNAHTTDAVKAVPQRGKAMIFYMKNPDGNLDDLSQHAAMPVKEGEKWFANLWTWDPYRD